MKCEASQELVVGGFTDPQRSRVGLGALLVGYFDGDDFVFAGKIGTGFDTKLLLDLRARLDRIETTLRRSRRHWPTHSRTLDFARNRRAGRFHRVDRAREAAPSSSAGHSIRQIGKRGCQGNVVITHPEKLLFPDGITASSPPTRMIAPVMLPHLRGRPITMERYPAGIDKKGFWQKDVSKGFPDWLERVKVPKKDGVVNHPIVTDTKSLLWLVNQNCITPHVWTSRAQGCTTRTFVCSTSIRPSTMRECCATQRSRSAACSTNSAFQAG
jgi:bifunctional non-homologous end joining protein LigD